MRLQLPGKLGRGSVAPIASVLLALS